MGSNWVSITLQKAPRGSPFPAFVSPKSRGFLYATHGDPSHKQAETTIECKLHRDSRAILKHIYAAVLGVGVEKENCGAAS